MCGSARAPRKPAFALPLDMYGSSLLAMVRCYSARNFVLCTTPPESSNEIGHLKKDGTTAAVAASSSSSATFL
jgi:hypothetical protein